LQKGEHYAEKTTEAGKGQAAQAEAKQERQEQASEAEKGLKRTATYNKAKDH